MKAGRGAGEPESRERRESREGREGRKGRKGMGKFAQQHEEPFLPAEYVCASHL
jgi:hypothetical protein